MKFDFELACDQLNSTNHSLLLEVSSSASWQHILTECIRSCTYMDTLPTSVESIMKSFHLCTIYSMKHLARLPKQEELNNIN